MKKLPLLIVFFSIFVSCSTEDDKTENLYSNHSISENKLNFGGDSINSFDSRGKKFNEVLLSYLKNNKYPDSDESLFNMIQFISDQYSVYGKENAIRMSQVISIKNTPIQELSDALENIVIGSEAKTKLKGFVEDLINLQGKDFNETSDYILSFQDDVSKNTILTDGEKEIILTISSISSYANKEESKRKDKDWETSVGNKKAQSLFTYRELSIFSVIAILQSII